MKAVIVVLVILAVGGLGYLAYRIDKQRRERMRAFAAQRGWTLADRDDGPLGLFSGEPFGTGERRKCRYVMHGQYRGRSILAMQYEYITTSTDSEGRRQQTTHRFQVGAVALPRVLPWLQVKREGMFSKLGHALGFHDIQMESEDFNRRFRVTSQNRKLASDVLHPRLMEQLLHSEGPAWRIEGGYLLCWDSGRLDLTRIEPWLDYCGGIADAIPAFVWADR